MSVVSSFVLHYRGEGMSSWYKTLLPYFSCIRDFRRLLAVVRSRHPAHIGVVVQGKGGYVPWAMIVSYNTQQDSALAKRLESLERASYHVE